MFNFVFSTHWLWYTFELWCEWNGISKKTRGNELFKKEDGILQRKANICLLLGLISEGPCETKRNNWLQSSSLIFTIKDTKQFQHLFRCAFATNKHRITGEPTVLPPYFFLNLLNCFSIVLLSFSFLGYSERRVLLNVVVPKSSVWF